MNFSIINSYPDISTSSLIKYFSPFYVTDKKEYVTQSSYICRHTLFCILNFAIRNTINHFPQFRRNVWKYVYLRQFLSYDILRIKERAISRKRVAKSRKNPEKMGTQTPWCNAAAIPPIGGSLFTEFGFHSLCNSIRRISRDILCLSPRPFQRSQSSFQQRQGYSPRYSGT